MDEIESLLEEYVCAVRVTKAREIDASACGTRMDYHRWRDAQETEEASRERLLRLLREMHKAVRGRAA